MCYFPPHLKCVASLPLGIEKFEFVVKLQNKVKTRIICHMAEWIVLLSQKLLKVSNACTHTCANMSTPLFMILTV